MTIDRDAEREAVARLLHRWEFAHAADFVPGEWDELLSDWERAEYRRKAMVLIDAIVGTVVELGQDAERKQRVAERDRDIYADALGEALEVIDALLAGHDDQRALHRERVDYFEALWGNVKPKHDPRCTSLAHHPECPDWRLPV